MISVQFTISMKEWLRDPNKRWNAGLERAGFSWRQGLQRSNYGTSPLNTGLYIRTGTLANKAGYRVTKEGQEMVFGSTDYVKAVLFGIGIYGSTGMPITVKQAPYLVFDSSPVIRAFQSRGYIWEGKLDEMRKLMAEGFATGIKEYSGV